MKENLLVSMFCKCRSYKVFPRIIRYRIKYTTYAVFSDPIQTLIHIDTSAFADNANVALKNVCWKQKLDFFLFLYSKTKRRRISHIIRNLTVNWILKFWVAYPGAFSMCEPKI